MMLEQIYETSLGLLTDLYQVSMAYAYWKSGTHEKESVFNLFFRQIPFHNGYAIAGGLETALEFIERFKIDSSDVEYLSTLKGSDNRPLFDADFLDYLSKLKLKIDVSAIPEGRVVFAHEPLLRVQGPILQCQLIETALLNIVNFQTLIATKAARVKEAAGSDSLLEFGLRRAQGIDGALMGTRAAFVGGCDATSNVLAGKLYGIPVRGTHAHSWVMSFETEREAFMEFAKAMPGNSTLLVDTYNTLKGVKTAIEAGKWLVKNGHPFNGIRLDSGDLAFLSIEARKLLDAAGFEKAQIVASNDLDENLIEDLKRQGARINVWGVGTKLITGYDQPALGGVYKLAATREPGKKWTQKIKLSEQAVKTTIPGLQQIRRFAHEEGLIGDMIYDAENPPQGDSDIVDPLDPSRRKIIPKNTAYEDLLLPVIEKGKRIRASESLTEIRKKSLEERLKLHPGVRRFKNPHNYPVGLEKSLYEKKTRMILEHRGHTPLKGTHE
jgi:nicotinate phosphoribosyltransferase